MASFKQGVLTSNALDMIARAQAGECTISFTKFALGSGTWSSSVTTATLQATTALKSKQAEFDITSVSYVNDATVELYLVASNVSNTSSGYYITEVGIYASDGSSEYLYAIYIAENADWFPVYNSITPSSIRYTCPVTVANAESVTLEIDSEVAEKSSFIIDRDDDDAVYAYHLEVIDGKPYMVGSST